MESSSGQSWRKPQTQPGEPSAKRDRSGQETPLRTILVIVPLSRGTREQGMAKQILLIVYCLFLAQLIQARNLNQAN